jgi:hypothetical protein
MKKVIALLLIASVVLSSCGRFMTPSEAASSRQRCGHGSVR